MLKILAIGTLAALSAAFAGTAAAHPYHGGHAGGTVIANYPIQTTTVPGYQTQVRPVQVPVTTYQTQYQAVQVPVQVPVQQVQVPVQQVQQVRQVYVQQPAVQVIQQPAVQVIQAPQQRVFVRGTVNPYDCICARSASGKRVNVFKTAARWQSVVETKIGGGKQLIDVRGFHQGYWRVAYRPKGESGIQYGWVREADLECKETRAVPRVGYGVAPQVRSY